MRSRDPMEPISGRPDPGDPGTWDIGWQARDGWPASTRGRRSRRFRLVRSSWRSRRSGTVLGPLAVGAAAAVIMALVTQSGTTARLSAVAQDAVGTPSSSTFATGDGYLFRTLDNPGDPTFNQLLGINDSGEIAGYFGSGAAGHPNKGYLVVNATTQKRTGHFVSENFPGSAQTQVTGLNAAGTTVGFWSKTNASNQASNANMGFYASGGAFHSVQFPTGNNASPVVDQLLGINDRGMAVGFYTNKQGRNRGYEYNIHTHQFTRVFSPGFTTANSLQSPSLTATAINDFEDVTGFYTASSGATDGFVKTPGGTFTQLAYPGASSTMALGISGIGEVVGVYTVGSGNNAPMHGFTWTPANGYASVSDPLGKDTTTINGVDVKGDLVGFYTDGAGNTHGFLATQVAGGMGTPSPTMTGMPAPSMSPSTMPTGMGGQMGGQGNSQNVTTDLRSMPTGNVLVSGQNGSGSVVLGFSVSGLTPGSSHTVELVNQNGGVDGTFTPQLTASSTGWANAGLAVSAPNGVPAGDRIVVLNGDSGTVPISQTQPLAAPISAQRSAHPEDAGSGSVPLTAVEIGSDGTSFGTPAGTAMVSYDAAARTLTVTVHASGLTPGPHAAHIHDGSCTSQGPVQYMIMDDMMANSQGVMDATRVIQDVTQPIPASGWYLNVHQGSSQTILANGQPTPDFRPLLCANL